MDALGDAAAVDALEAHVRSRDLQFLRISAVTGDGLDELQEAVWKHLSDTKPAQALIATHE
ncbi:hypothetical protein D3C83_129560 [compost metagenome]